jgi:hypothetical protein
VNEQHVRVRAHHRRRLLDALADDRNTHDIVSVERWAVGESEEENDHTIRSWVSIEDRVVARA